MNYQALTFLTLFFALIATGTTRAQEAQEATDIVLRVRTSPGGNLINWYPTNPNTWRETMNKGYRLTRVPLTESGAVAGAESVLQVAMFPQPPAWFNAHQGDLDGLMAPIGSLLYDTTFQFPENDLLDEVTMKYNFIVFETTQFPGIAHAAGLGFQDTLALPGVGYRYSISSADGSLKGSIDLPTGQVYAQVPEISPVEFVFPAGKSLSQMYYETHPVEIGSVKLLHRAMGDSIILRWGPSTPTLWERATKDGYQIYRSNRDEELELIAEVFPWKQDEITESLKGNPSALAAASVLYGERKETNDDNFVEEAMQYENRHGMALFAAEQSPLAAEILGLRYVDNSVKADSGYTYIVRTPSLTEPLLWGRTVAFNTYVPVQAPVDFRAVPGDKVIRLTWDKNENERLFSAYQVERAAGDGNYIPLHDQLLIFGENRNTEIKEFYFEDTVGVNEELFQYRVRGMTSFAEWSTYAYVEAEGQDLTPPGVAQIIDGRFNDTTKIFYLDWVPPTPMDADLNHYQVLLGQTYDGDFNPVSNYLSKDSTSYTFGVGDMDTDRGFYFKIQSVDYRGNVSESLPYPVIVPDITSPPPPAWVRGTIDSLGVVNLSWAESEAKDVRGYWVYWSNSPQKEMALFNEDLIKGTSYTHVVERKTLNKKLYVVVRAEDDAYNRGLATEILAVDRPDKVPPQPPAVGAIKVEAETAVVNWRASASDDVVKYILLRREEEAGFSSWTELVTLSADQLSFTDEEVVIGKSYEYSMKALDDAGNVSRQGNVQSVKIPFPAEEVAVTAFTAVASQDQANPANTLSWEYTPPERDLRGGDYEFVVYRGSGARALQEIAKVPAGTMTYTDNDIYSSVLYNYAVRVRFANGWQGAMSPVKSILSK